MENSFDKSVDKLKVFKKIASKEHFSIDCIRFLDDLPNNSKIAIACSGGSDSVLLIYFILTYYSRFSQNIHTLHFNHNLREEHSDGDEIFVQNLSKNFNLKFNSERLDTTNLQISESNLREKRYDFFSRKMQEIGSNVLLLGQQKNDIAETILMRLTRSSGSGGLSAPKPISIFDWQYRLRPLLELKKSEIESILTKIDQTWRTDSSNFTEDFFRNRIRKNVLPELQKSIPQYDVIDSLANSRKMFEEDNDALEFFANEHCNFLHPHILETKQLKILPKAIIRRVLYRWISVNKIVLKKQNFEKLLDATHNSYNIKINFKPKKFVIHKRNLLRIADQSF